MLICKRNLHTKKYTSILIKPDGQTDRHTDGRTDISIYRVASLLKRNLLQWNNGYMIVLMVTRSSRYSWNHVGPNRQFEFKFSLDITEAFNRHSTIRNLLLTY